MQNTIKQLGAEGSSATTFLQLKLQLILQSLEFVTETRILAEMKIETRGKKTFPWKKKLTSILFFKKNET